MATKEDILSELRRTAKANGGKPLGAKKFADETGIEKVDVYRYWARWNDAIKEAGLPPNQLNSARSDEDILSRLAVFVLQLGHFPVKNEIDLRARQDSGFPWTSTLINRYGNRARLAESLRQFCQDRGQENVAKICATAAKPAALKPLDDSTTSAPPGYVYLVRHGSRREYKIGKTFNPIR